MVINAAKLFPGVGEEVKAILMIRDIIEAICNGVKDDGIIVKTTKIIDKWCGM